MKNFLENSTTKNILFLNFPDECYAMSDYIVDIFKKRNKCNSTHKFYVNKLFKMDDVIDLISKGDLFSENIYIEILFESLSSDKLQKQIMQKISTEMWKDLSRLIDKIDNNIFLTIKCDKLKKETTSELFKKISTLGTQLSIRPENINTIIEFELKSNDLKINTDALAELIRLNHGNTNSLMQDLKKLVILFTTNYTITLSDIKNNIISDPNYNIYELSDKYLNGNFKASIEIFENIYLEYKDAILIQWCFHEDVKKLLKIKAFLTQDSNINIILKKLFIYNTRSYMACINRLSTSSIIEILNQIAMLDLINKGVIKSDQKEKLIYILSLFCK